MKANFEDILVPRHDLPRVKVVDVTLRDGGFRTNFAWTMDEVLRIATSTAAAGADYVELGYMGGVPELHGVANPGPTANVSPDVVASVRHRLPSAGLAAMIHPQTFDSTAPFPDFKAAGLELVRLVYHPSWHEKLAALVDSAKAAGLRVSVNVALASRYAPEELAETIGRVLEIHPDVLYIADTCASLMPQDVTAMFANLPGVRADWGIHAHDFLSLAFANSLAAVSNGARYVDGSLFGIGRGAGNLRLELWLAFAQGRGGERGCIRAIGDGLAAVEARLGSLQVADLASIACGVLNLTPPQEDALRGHPLFETMGSAGASSFLLDNYRDYETVGTALNAGALAET